MIILQNLTSNLPECEAWTISSVVERLTVNQNVVGSIPTLPVGDT